MVEYKRDYGFENWFAVKWLVHLSRSADFSQIGDQSILMVEWFVGESRFEYFGRDTNIKNLKFLELKETLKPILRAFNLYVRHCETKLIKLDFK